MREHKMHRSSETTRSLSDTDEMDWGCKKKDKIKSRAFLKWQKIEEDGDDHHKKMRWRSKFDSR